MATKASSLRHKKFKRTRFDNNLFVHILTGGNTHKITKKPKGVIVEKYTFSNTSNNYRNISRKNKIKNKLWNVITHSSSIYYTIEAYFAVKNKGNFIKYVYDPFSPINSRTIATKYVMAKFYEMRDLSHSLNVKDFSPNKKIVKI